MKVILSVEFVQKIVDGVIFQKARDDLKEVAKGYSGIYLEKLR